jgi:(p)ppGpp synthase/HD superfamily hydrolase
MSTNNKSLIERAVAIALEAHAGQVDKAGAPYILHPLRLMTQMQTEEEQLAAVLHDVVEDSDFTFEALQAEGIPEEVIETLKLLTHQETDSYEAYVRKIKPHPVARKVKLADLADNMRLDRIPHPTEKDITRLQKYSQAIQLLEAR